MPLGRYLTTRDPDEMALLEQIRSAAWEELDQMLTVLARRIVKEYADAQKRK